MSRRRAETSLDSGTKTASRITSATGWLAFPPLLGPDEVLGVGHADDVVDPVLFHRDAAEPRGERRLQGVLAPKRRPRPSPCRAAATITSRVTVSPKSITEWMKLRSSFSITFSSWATSAMALSSESVMKVWGMSSSPSSEAPMIQLANPISTDESQRMGGKRTRVLTRGALRSAARSAFCTAQFFGTASKNTKITTTSNTAPRSTPRPPKRCSATMPTRVAETSWQMRTRRRIGLRKLAGFSTRRASWRAPWRCSSTSALALILFMRTRLVSAMASTPEPASSTAMTTMRMPSRRVEPRSRQE